MGWGQIDALTVRGWESIRVLVQQCEYGLDGNPGSRIHFAHEHSTKHGHPVWCRGWFPTVSVKRGGIKYGRRT